MYGNIYYIFLIFLLQTYVGSHVFFIFYFLFFVMEEICRILC